VPYSERGVNRGGKKKWTKTKKSLAERNTSPGEIYWEKVPVVENRRRALGRYKKGEGEGPQSEPIISRETGFALMKKRWGKSVNGAAGSCFLSRGRVAVRRGSS